MTGNKTPSRPRGNRPGGPSRRNDGAGSSSSGRNGNRAPGKGFSGPRSSGPRFGGTSGPQGERQGDRQVNRQGRDGGFGERGYGPRGGQRGDRNDGAPRGDRPQRDGWTPRGGGRPYRDDRPMRNDRPKRADSKPAPKRQAAPKPQAVRVAPEVSSHDGERIAKVMARAGLCSRRDAEVWITNGRVSVNGTVLTTPAITVTEDDIILVDGEPLPQKERTRLWLYHKPRGLVTTNFDPEGRPTVFEKLPADLPRVVSVGRLDINTEGLLLLTNDGGLARVLELPSTGWLRRYRVRAFGEITQDQLNALADGVAIDGVLYGGIEAVLDKTQGDNVWLTLGLREGKNREVKRVLEHLGLSVNRLIRLSFGPFQLLDLPEGEAREIKGRVLRDQLGDKLAEAAGADFEAPVLTLAAPKEEPKKKKPQQGPKTRGEWMTAREGAQAVNRPKGPRKPRPEGGERSFGAREGGRDGSRAGGKRERGESQRPQKISPRSRFRLTREPSVRKAEDERPQRAPRPRRIWGDEGLVEDKQQEQRTGRDRKPAFRDPDDRPIRPRERSERGDRPDRGNRPVRSGPGGPKRGGGDGGGFKPRSRG
ncbi:pseudouridine synthase [Pannonibacter indicus]|uniref:Pseudouridine synthase n=1 Tax=Pannonibacter indicus TaxID=466044 RepID=A0A0K6HVC2_9HYPH|nr:pseudouridine synthase [Pannonibacter indicus]CUA94786.1 pseudouridine synthase [Pannonibacter indicus]